MKDGHTTIELSESDALLIVDVQNDFLPGGALAVPEGDKVIPVLNNYIGAFKPKRLPVYATRDWHPPNHCSFREQGGPWPAHCVAGSQGAAFASALRLPPDAIVISKATTVDKEAYSGFEGTDLEQQLKRRGIQRLFVGGLATDYCVLKTVQDALRLRFKVYLLEDAVRAVDVQSGDGERALQSMTQLRAIRTRFENIAT